MAGVIYLYKGKTPTREKRFWSASDYSSWRSNSTTTANRTILTTDDNIGVNPNYIDITISQGQFTGGSTDYMFGFSYMEVYGGFTVSGSNITNNFCAFIDKVEINNISQSGAASYRIYFTIDYWHTLLQFAFEGEGYPELYGEVIRAHVCDVESGYPTLDYTTNDMEVLPNTNDAKIYAKTFNSMGGTQLGLTVENRTLGLAYVVCTAALVSDTTGSYCYASRVPSEAPSASGYVGNVSWYSGSMPLYVAVIPYNIDSGSLYSVQVGSSGTVYSPSFNNISELLSTNVLGVIYTRTIPYNINMSGSADVTILNTVTTNKLYISCSIATLSQTGVETLGYSALPFVNYNSGVGITTDILVAIDSTIMCGNNALTEPTTYEEYKSQVIKFYSHAYNSCFVDICDDKREILYTNIDSSIDGSSAIFNATESFATGAFTIVNYNKNNQTWFSNVSVSNTSRLQPPIVSDDYWDRYNAQIATVKNGFGIAQGANQIQQADYSMLSGTLSAMSTGDLSNITDSYGQATSQRLSGAENIAINSMELVRNQAYANGGLAQGRVAPDFVSSLSRVTEPVLWYINNNDEDVLLNLIYYGYNTHVNVRSIYTQDSTNIHLRKYFNFIRTKGCNFMNYNEAVGGMSPPLEVKSAIENMFNRGVWLFHFVDYDTCFDLEVNNYCVNGY